ncbi:MAG: S1 RNA-binding domain-containing protein [Patescibacteria group bacterium]|nr:S1 RNA-binding domain-containing protein [Patescibacteria group bacterium]
MTTNKTEGKEKINKNISAEDFSDLIEQHQIVVPNVNEIVKGKVIAASRSEVKLDIGGYMTGVVRGPELYEEDDDYANLQPGDEVEATVIEPDNENGDLELSFRYAGQERAWNDLRGAFSDKMIIPIKIQDANKGGLMVKYRQIAGFLPVSQLAPENYPRINGGDKSKILDRLKSYVGREFKVKVITLDEKQDKIIFSEKEAWNERQQDVIEKYKVGIKVEGEITAITNFGVFINFGENLEGLIHISELAWQRIDDPSDLYKVGDNIKAEVISVENSKIFLSAKKLMTDPWDGVDKKYKAGDIVQGKILKVNPFGLFVSLDDDIHGLAHISQLDLEPKDKINEEYSANKKINFEIVSIEAKDHRLGLSRSKKALNADKKEAGKKEKTEKKSK